MRNITLHRACDRDYDERMTYYRQLEVQGKKKKSKSRQKKGFWQRAFNGSLGAVSPKVFQRMMKMITVTGLLSKQKLIEVIRKLENLNSTLAQRVNPQLLLRSQPSKERQIVESYGLTGARLFKRSVIEFMVGCEKNSAKGSVLSSGFSKGKKVYPSYSKIVKSSYQGKKAKDIHIISQADTCLYDGDSFDQTQEDRVRQTELVLIPNATVVDLFIKKPPLIEAYHRYMNAQGADRQQAYTCFEALLRNSKDNINDRDSDGRTLLHYAAANNDLKTATKVINCPKADLNIQDNNGDTPLHTAAGHNANNLAIFLIENNASVCTVNNQRVSGLDIMESKNILNITATDKIKDNLVNSMSASPGADSISSNGSFQKLLNDKCGELICQS